MSQDIVVPQRVVLCIEETPCSCAFNKHTLPTDASYIKTPLETFLRLLRGLSHCYSKSDTKIFLIRHLNRGAGVPTHSSN